MKTAPKQLAQGVGAFILLWTAASCMEQPVLERTGRTLATWVDDPVVYSIIVEATNPRPSSQFADKSRVQYFSRFIEGVRVASVQYIDHLEQEETEQVSMTVGKHPDGVDKRVRMAFVADSQLRNSPRKVRQRGGQENAPTTLQHLKIAMH